MLALAYIVLAYIGMAYIVMAVTGMVRFCVVRCSYRPALLFAYTATAFKIIVLMVMTYIVFACVFTDYTVILVISALFWTCWLVGISASRCSRSCGAHPHAIKAHTILAMTGMPHIVLAGPIMAFVVMPDIARVRVVVACVIVPDISRVRVVMAF